MIDTRRSVLVVTLSALALGAACTVGEARPEPPEPEVPADTVERPERTDTVGVAAPGDIAADYRATDVLIRSQLAYEAAEVDEALRLAERVLADFPDSPATEPARWLGARAAFALGRYAQAREMAEAYAARQPSGSTLRQRALDLADLAEDALAEPSAAPAVIGAVLPRSGPRVLVRYGDWVLEGIELAIAEAERQQDRTIDLVVVDDSGGSHTYQAVQELERMGVLAVVGPLLSRQLPAAADARSDGNRILISPTATGVVAWPQTYSVSSEGSRGAQRLGQYAADVGFGQAALLFARGTEYERKAQAFAVEYETLGGDVKAMVPYDSGTTTFGPHMDRILRSVAPEGTVADSAAIARLVELGYLPDAMAADTMSRDSLDRMAELLRLFDRSAMAAEARDTMAMDTTMSDTADGWTDVPQQRPFALFVAGPNQDVPKIAPQVAFYDLDSAGVQVFGDEAWTTPDVRRVVPRRDLEGVIAASQFPPDRADGAADPAFVELYESRYRQSLANPLPALGYDAANLVLQALPNRMLTPVALARRFRFLTGIRGATGELSVRAGQVVRTPFLVEIRGGQLRPAPYPWEYEMPEPVPPKPDSADEEGGRDR